MCGRHRDAQVCAQRDLEAGFDGEPVRGLVVFGGLEHFAIRLGRHQLRVVDAEPHDRPGRHVDGTVLLKRLDALVVHVRAVLDRVAPRTQRRQNPVLSVAVGGDDAARAVGLVHDHLQLCI